MNGQALHDLVAFRTNSVGFLQRIARERGDVAPFQLGRQRALLLVHPAAVRALLVDQADAFTKGRLIQRARRLLGDGLLTSEGELHRQQRRRIQAAFSRRLMARYMADVPAIAAADALRYPRTGSMPLGAAMDALAMTIVAKTLFGADIIERVPQIARALHTLARWAPVLIVPGADVIEKWLPATTALRTLDAALTLLIERNGSDSPLLHALLQHGADGPMSPQQVRDEVMTIFLAGHDTTAAALTWTWLLLAEHPAVRDELRHEVSAVTNGRRPTADDVSKLTYTDAVVSEVLRMFPPISRIGRRAIRDVTIDGAAIRAGSTVFVSPWVTQRDARWFEAPACFTPERWLTSRAVEPFAFFPFGAGPRSCIGAHFARAAITLAMATLVTEWCPAPVTAGLPRPRSLLTLKPGGEVRVRALQCPVTRPLTPRCRTASSSATE